MAFTRNSDVGVVFCTVGDEKNANDIAKALVESKLAACVNKIKGVSSVFVWEDKLEEVAEVLLIIKTRKKRFAAIKTKILEMHKYSLPEIIYLSVEDGYSEYMKWVAERTHIGK